MKSASAAAAVALALLCAIGPAVASPKIAQMDFTRTRRSSGRLSRRAKTVQADLVNNEFEGFYALNVSVGTPAQNMQVLFDTGSSDFWVPVTGSRACRLQTSLCDELGSFDPDSSSTFQDVQGGFSSEYGDGTTVSGDFGNDTVVIGGAKLPGAIVGVVTGAKSQTPLTGIMGIGYAAGEAIVEENHGDLGDKYSNIIAQMKSSGVINTQAYSLWLNDLDSSSGNILFGGIDSDKFTGPLVTLPVVKNSETGNFDQLSIVWTSMSFVADGKASSLTNSSFAWPALLDSGTTQTALPNDLVDAINNGLGVVNDEELGPILPCADGQDASAMFTWGFGGPSGITINVPISEVIYPITDEDNQTITYPNGGEVCGLALTGGADDIGLAVLGDVFLRSAYVVYDLDNNQISLAQTKFNVSTSNIQEINSGSSVPGATQVASTVTAAVPTAMETETGNPEGPSIIIPTGTQTDVSETSATATFGFTPNPAATGPSGGSGTSGGTAASSSKSVAGPSVKLAKIEPAMLVACAVTVFSALAGALFIL